MAERIAIAIAPTKERDFDDSQASELFKVKWNQVRMMKDRGYNTTSEDPLGKYRVSDFIKTYRGFAEQQKISFKDALKNVYTKDDGQTQTLVYYSETPKDAKGPKKVGFDQIKSIIEMMQGTNITHIILITETALTTEAAGAFRDIPLYRMEHFLYEEMTYYPLDHFLVSKHRLLSETEAADFLRDSNSQLTDLQAIAVDDRIARHLGAVPGQIFEITRENLSIDTLVDTYKSHRYVSHTSISLPK